LAVPEALLRGRDKVQLSGAQRSRICRENRVKLMILRIRWGGEGKAGTHEQKLKLMLLISITGQRRPEERSQTRRNPAMPRNQKSGTDYHQPHT
jgi:hypothetical protein